MPAPFLFLDDFTRPFRDTLHHLYGEWVTARHTAGNKRRPSKVLLGHWIKYSYEISYESYHQEF
jgi:hypothetical protein